MNSNGQIRTLDVLGGEDAAYRLGFVPVPQRLELAARTRHRGEPETRDEARRLAEFQAAVPAKLRAHERAARKRKRKRAMVKASKRRNGGRT